MDRIYYQTLTVPAGTPITAPVTAAWPLEDNLLKHFTVQVPDGHCGLTGFRVLQAQQQVVPFANNSYIVSNDRTFPFEWDDEITSTGLVLSGYNIDIFPHTFYCTALVTNIPVPGTEPPAAVTPLEAPSAPIGIDTDELTPDAILGTTQTPTIPPTPVPIPLPKKTPPKFKPKPVKPPTGLKHGGPVKKPNVVRR
jgi:hypothetical protein